jgi:hypothetical protein
MSHAKISAVGASGDVRHASRDGKIPPQLFESESQRSEGPAGGPENAPVFLPTLAWV